MAEPSPAYVRHLRQLHHDLTIPEDFLDTCPMPLHAEATDLVDAGVDVFERPQRMTAATYRAWQRMLEAAADDEVALLLVSAFRSLDYQCQLIRGKLADGRAIGDVLQVNAAPGFSEHHTGCALDLTTNGVEPLTDAFEATAAFVWLTRRGGEFGFTLSYPRDNVYGIAYEPWHWAYGARAV